MKVCSVEDCENRHYGHGYCNKHVQQMHFYGRIKNRTIQTPNDFIMEDGVCKISLHNRDGSFVGYALIDTEDADKCKLYKWSYSKRYVRSGNCPTTLLHNFVLNIKGVDHKNRNTLDCRKENLRPCNQSQNNCNKIVQKNNTSGYKGVFLCTSGKNSGKWFSKIRKDRIAYHPGFFDDIVEAAKAYDTKALELHGEFAYQNFPKPVLKRRITNA